MDDLIKKLAEISGRENDTMFEGNVQRRADELQAIRKDMQRVRDINVGDIVRVRNEWQHTSKLGNYPCVVEEVFEPIIMRNYILHNIHNGGNGIRDILTNHANDVLNASVIYLNEDDHAVTFIVDLRKFEKIDVAADERNEAENVS